MFLSQIESTYICQLSKPQNKKVLEEYSAHRDKSGAELANYYKDIINMLYGTPAWNVSGVNKMINELTGHVRATLNRAKKGKTTAYAQANIMLGKLKEFEHQEAHKIYEPRQNLCPLLTVDELMELAAQ